MPALDAELKTYAAMQVDLENENMGQWILIKEKKVVGFFPTFDEAASAAVGQFGRGPYLIRQIGAGDCTLPASLAFFR